MADRRLTEGVKLRTPSRASLWLVSLGLLIGACTGAAESVDPATLTPVLLRPFVATCRADPPSGTATDLYLFTACGDAIERPSFPISMDRPRGEAQDQIDELLTRMVRGTSPTERDVGMYSGFDWLDTEVRAELEVETTVDDGVARVGIIRAGEPYVPTFFMISPETWASFALPMSATVFQFEEISSFQSDYCFTTNVNDLQTGCVVSRADYEATAGNFGADPACLPLGLWFDPACDGFDQ